MQLEKVNSVAEFEQAISSSAPAVALFKADWCKDCRFIEPFMPEVAAHYADRLRIFVVDRDALPELAEKYNILGIPSFVAFLAGRETISFISKLRKTREEIEGFLERVLQVSGALAESGRSGGGEKEGNG